MIQKLSRYLCMFCLCCPLLWCGPGPAHAANSAEEIAPPAMGGTGDGEVGDDYLRLGLQQEGYIGAESIDVFTANHPPRDENAREDALTLYQACELAIQRHPLVESSRASKRESEASYDVARSVYYPRIDLKAQVGPTHYLNDGSRTNGEAALSVTQTIFNFGGLQNGVDSAELKAAGARLRHARTQEDIAALVVNSYFTILQSQELVTVYETSLDFYKKLLETFWERFNAGISSKADSEKVKVSMKAAESQLTIQNQQLQTAKNLLENIIKQPVTDIDPNVDTMRVVVAGSMEESFASALKNNASLRAYTAEIKAQELAIKARGAEYLPSFGYRVQAKNEFLEHYEKRPSVGAQVTMNWNLFNGFASDAKIRKEKAVLDRMIATKEALELDIRNILTDAFNAYSSSEKEFALAKDAYDSSVYLMGLYLSEFDLGIRTLLDLIQAREGQTTAAVREVNARYARIRSILNIVLEEGRLPAVLELPISVSATNPIPGY